MLSNGDPMADAGIEPTPLASRFLSLLPEALPRRTDQLEQQLERQLRLLLERVEHAALPCAVDHAALLDHLARRLQDPSTLPASLERVHVEDLALAWACAEGHAAAIEELERLHFDVVEVALARLPDAAAQAEEIKQQLRDALFMGPAGRRPKIAQYSGLGSLRAWLRITATRQALNQLKRHRREVELKEEVLDRLASPTENQEIGFLKRRYRAQFKRAFSAALSSLSSQERNVLRYNYLERLNIDQIGAIYSVHRATVARWLARIRGDLLKRTRQALMQELQISHAEFESIMRLIDSQLEASIDKHLRR